MIEFKTHNFHGYSVEYSPFSSSRVACAAGQNFGLKGEGHLFVLDNTTSGLVLYRRFPWSDVLFDLTWSESDYNTIITGSGDGTIQVWNIEQPQGPSKVLKEHTKEVYSVDWSLTRDVQLFISGSWDHTIKLWDPSRSDSLDTFIGHKSVIYCVSWSPRLPGVFLSSSGDGSVHTWDIRQPSHEPAQVTSSGSGEVLSCDWTKYEQYVIATTGTDSTIKIWDLRSPMKFVCTLVGHRFPARRIKCSPHQQSLLVTASYDLTVRLWDYMASPHPVETIKHHTEFVTGIDFNLHHSGEITDCSWDQSVKMYVPESIHPTER